MTAFFIASGNGALNGAMPAMTPSGRRTVKPNCPGMVVGIVVGIVLPEERRISATAVRKRSKQ
jgi:hypothetical protein